MEKLQAALKMARDKRAASGISPASEKQVSNTADAPARTSVDDRWQSLTPLTIDEKRLAEHRIVTLSGGRSSASFDILQTKILMQMEKHGWKRLAITSPSIGCGKTTISCNLAAGLIRQTDKRAVVFEMDMRKPSMARVFDYKPTYSVADFLNERVQLADQAVKLGANIALCMNSGPQQNPANLFLRETTGRVLDAVEKDYEPDLIVFDLPPLLVNDDARALLKHSDCALLVAGAGVSKIDQIDVCEREIAEQTNVLGTVLNKCEYIDENYGYEYGYGDQ